MVVDVNVEEVVREFIVLAYIPAICLLDSADWPDSCGPCRIFLLFTQFPSGISTDVDDDTLILSC